MKTLLEPAREIPVIDEADICVIGGSCTGVFAAVRAARLGAKVIIIEKQNCFGGVATSGMVSIWHSLYDTEYKNQIIAGLTREVLDRLKKRKAVVERQNIASSYRMNTEELKIDLDNLILESDIKPYLHTLFVEPYTKDGNLNAVIIENKSGRGAVRAKNFIDATGDGDLCAFLGLPFIIPAVKQPPTTCAKIYGMHTLGEFNVPKNVIKYKDEFELPELWGWGTCIPEVEEVTFQAITKIYKANCTDAVSLTKCEIEGRRQIRAIMDIIRKYGPEESRVILLALPSYIGVRETRHFNCQYRLTEEDVLNGKRFNDAIANGTYGVDIHHDDKPGVTFRYLDGREVYSRYGEPNIEGRWREETETNPTFYQIPYRSMVPGKYDNLILAGRMIDADKGAYGAIRVMVNMNQTGEAAGVASWLALDSGKSIGEIDVEKLRELLADGSSIII